MSEILFCKIVPCDTNVFISIMFEHEFTKIRISQETIVDPCELPFDASLVSNYGPDDILFSEVFPHLWP